MWRDINLIGAHLDRIQTDDFGESKSSARCHLQRLATKVLATPSFDVVMGGIILLNMIVIVIDTDWIASEDESIAGKMPVIEVFSWLVLVIFILEMLVRLIALECDFWKDAWNVVDFTIVVVDLLFSIIGFVAEDFPLSILRVFRLAKLARIPRLLRLFPELKMMIVGLSHSLRAIFWGTVMLVVFLLVWSVVAVLVIHPLNEKIDYGESCERCPRAYSTVFQAALTFWQQIVTGDSWGLATIPVIEEYPATVLFFGPVFMSIGLCVLNLMLAIIINFAQRVYDLEVEKEQAESALSEVQHRHTIVDLCSELDTDKDGELSFAEIQAGFQQEGELREAMRSAGFTEDLMEMAWTLMDADESGGVSFKEFVTFLFQMKGARPHFMLAYIKYYMTWMKNAIENQMNTQAEILLKESSRVERELALANQRLKEQQAAILEEENELQRVSKSIGQQTAVLEQEHVKGAESNKPLRGAKGFREHLASILKDRQVILSDSEQDSTLKVGELRHRKESQLQQHTGLGSHQAAGRLMPATGRVDAADIDADKGYHATI